jgi:hypothetical protein
VWPIRTREVAVQTFDPGQYEREMINQLMNGNFRDPHSKKFQVVCEVFIYMYIYGVWQLGKWKVRTSLFISTEVMCCCRGTRLFHPS